MMDIPIRRLAVRATLTLALAGCAGLPPGLAPDPGEAGGMLVSVPGVDGAPARIERIDAPDNGWRRPEASPPPRARSPLPAGAVRQIQSVHELPGALDVVVAALPDYFDGGPSGGLLDALAAGRPPQVDGAALPVVASLEPLGCEPVQDLYFVEIMRHVCRDPGGRFDRIRFVQTFDTARSPSDDLARYRARAAVGFNFDLVRRRLLEAGLTKQRPVRPSEPYPHLPIAEDFTLFAPPGAGPVVVLQHGRGEAREFVRTMTVYLPVR